MNERLVEITRNYLDGLLHHSEFRTAFILALAEIESEAEILALANAVMAHTSEA